MRNCTNGTEFIPSLEPVAGGRGHQSLPQLRLGPIRLDFPVVQAALSGYSDWAMRVVARRLGAPYTLCEVLLDKFVIEVTRGKKAQRYLRVTDEEHPVGAQLMGADPSDFGPAAERLVAAGFDVIDINFGCPVKKVLGRCRGGYLLSQVDTALEIVARTREAVPPHIPVTVKMRRGLDDSAESRDKFYRIFDGAFALGVAAITVHGRTVHQRYVGPSRWDFLRELKRHAGSRTVLGSGDLFTPQACLDMIRETGVDGVTAARGAIGNPWIFQQVRALAAGLPLPEPPTIFEQRAVIAEHYQLAEELYGPEICGRHMRKFAIKYSKLHPLGLEVRDAFVRTCRPEQWRAVFAQYYAADGPGRHPGVDIDETEGCEA
jgi:nifR3 family TIM-barrel protein